MVTIECSSIEDGINKVAKLLVTEIETTANDLLILHENVDTGYLLNSSEITKTNDGYKLEWKAPYSEDVEYGSDPHWVPIEDLLKWGRHKGIDENFIYAIQKKIAKEGTQPHPFVMPAIYKVIDKYR